MEKLLHLFAFFSLWTVLNIVASLLLAPIDLVVIQAFEGFYLEPLSQLSHRSDTFAPYLGIQPQSRAHPLVRGFVFYKSLAFNFLTAFLVMALAKHYVGKKVWTLCLFFCVFLVLGEGLSGLPRLLTSAGGWRSGSVSYTLWLEGASLVGLILGAISATLLKRNRFDVPMPKEGASQILGIPLYIRGIGAETRQIVLLFALAVSVAAVSLLSFSLVQLMYHLIDVNSLTSRTLWRFLQFLTIVPPLLFAFWLSWCLARQIDIVGGSSKLKVFLAVMGLYAFQNAVFAYRFYAGFALGRKDFPFHSLLEITLVTTLPSALLTLVGLAVFWFTPKADQDEEMKTFTNPLREIQKRSSS